MILRPRIICKVSSTAHKCSGLLLVLFIAAGVLTGAELSGGFNEAAVREAAMAGDVQAQLLLGTYYFNKGSGAAETDLERACHWFRQAAKAEHPEGYYNLAVCLEHGFGTPQNTAEALELYRKAGEAGLLPARLQWAILTISTSGDTEKATKTIEDLAAASYPPAQNYLGELALQQAAEISTTSPSQAEELLDKGEDLFIKAAGTGYVPACSNAARQLLSRSRAGQTGRERAGLARIFLQKAADRNDSDSMAQLAFCIENGIGSDDGGDVTAAKKLYQQAAELGNPGAILRIGEFILAGSEAEPSDPEKAFEYFQKAAASGNPAAALRVGMCYAEGIGTTRDAVKAADRFLIAARAEIPEAQFNLACLFFKGDGIPKDPDAAYYWFKRAAGNGDIQACKQVAYCCFYGIGTKQDEQEGIKWLMQAARDGDEEAKKLLTGE